MQPSPLFIKSDVPSGRSGDWSIEKFTVQSPAHDDSRPACFQSSAGTYTRLKEGNEVFMTDLYDEWWTQRHAIAQARQRGGSVLITGLGLGVIVASILHNPGRRVEHITVIERSADVIALVAPSLEKRYGDRLAIINADAFEWQTPPDASFSVAWHDIWPNPHQPGVLTQAERLERRYGSCCAWQGNWVRDYLATEKAESQA